MALQHRQLTQKRHAIRKIAVNFCGIDEADVSDAILQAKKKRPYPVARARIVPLEPAPETQATGSNEDADPSAAEGEEDQLNHNKEE